MDGRYIELVNGDYKPTNITFGVYHVVSSTTNHSYPLVMTNIAIANSHFTVDLPMNSLVIFRSYVNVSQKVFPMV